ncbi:MAG: hypothetical protein P8N50_05425 [Actinomycetota bacterium]|jgi:uncharacterized OsmC-like protein|nr:hypothetical protein [Actinomycetota bacterium]
MAAANTVTRVTSVSTATKGRVINSARNNHWVIDSPSGPGEAISTGESFLAGLSSCAVTLVQSIAAEDQVALGPLSVEVSSHRVPEKPYDYDRIDVAFAYEGLALPEAERLTESWKGR